jgi:hypothetical protein
MHINLGIPFISAEQLPGEVVGALGLNLVDRIQHDHSLGDFSIVFLKLAGLLVTAPDFKSYLGHLKFFVYIMLGQFVPAKAISANRNIAGAYLITYGLR